MTSGQVVQDTWNVSASPAVMVSRQIRGARPNPGRDVGSGNFVNRSKFITQFCKCHFSSSSRPQIKNF